MIAEVWTKSNDDLAAVAEDCEKSPGTENYHQQKDSATQTTLLQFNVFWHRWLLLAQTFYDRSVKRCKIGVKKCFGCNLSPDQHYDVIF